VPTEYYVNIKAYKGSAGIDPITLNFDTRWRSEINFMPHPYRDYNPGPSSP